MRLWERWCLRPELNQRHADFQSAALPTELQRQMATRKGLEPSTSGVTGRRSNQLNYRAIGGNNRTRTCDIMLVRHALYQLSYAPPPKPPGMRFSFPRYAAWIIILNRRKIVNTQFTFWAHSGRSGHGFQVAGRLCRRGGFGHRHPQRRPRPPSLTPNICI